jgi:hypothetical protein
MSPAWDTPRDPARIEPTLEAVRQAWKANPDWRLAQLILNAARRAGAEPFYIEDDRITEQLVQITARGDEPAAPPE